ncbi:ABC transporter substrate binding protein [Vibrio hannami]|uniref:ABC transporter substrate binding protein n=1 Tax=Vibrio hannami TaxID=2717094 RepID=UPI0024107FAB|nr:ABC transporter substrate binding protein [Vibrio hannami]MDG3086058.1 ABC transporter substrate binding protein [Vibrio hannami]
MELLVKTEGTKTFIFADFLSVLSRALLFTTLLCSLALQPAYAERKKKILVLQSYHQGLEWSDNVSAGIQEIFAPLQTEYEVYYEYLDSKRNAGSEYLAKIANYINLKNSNVQYELIITVDNNALSVLNQGIVNFHGNPPVIFTGLNNYKPELISNIEQVTGIVETTDHKSTIDLMLTLHPNSKNITVILDQTPTGNQIYKDFRKFEKYYPDVTFQYLRNFLLTDIPQIVRNFHEDELLYLLTFNRDSANNFISYTEGIEMIVRHTKAPLYGSWGFYLDKGIVGGKLTTGKLQGKTAGEIALRILNGQSPNSIEILKNSPTQFMFDYAYVSKYRVNEELLPKSSIIINKPPGWLERNKTTLLNIFIFLFMTVLIILYFNTQKQNRLQAEYANHLEEKVKQRTEKLKEANEQLQRLSEVDGLSQLYNRRYFDKTLSDELQRHQRSKHPLVLMMCDIDFFKNYNDTYGHIEGDNCIKQVAKLLQSQCMRTNDTVARYGGEEFAIILPMTDTDSAHNIAEKICSNLYDTNIPHTSSSVADRITISIGVAVVTPDQSSTPTDIISIADKALYNSKHNGRNQYTLQEHPNVSDVSIKITKPYN